MKMGFHPKWVNLIMDGISFVSYSVLVKGVLQAILEPLKAFARGIHCHPIYSYYVLKVSRHYSETLPNTGIYMVSVSLGVDLRSPTFYLQMTACFSAVPPYLNATLSRRFCTSMN